MSHNKTTENYKSPAMKVITVNAAKVLCLSKVTPTETSEEENMLP